MIKVCDWGPDLNETTGSRPHHFQRKKEKKSVKHGKALTNQPPELRMSTVEDSETGGGRRDGISTVSGFTTKAKCMSLTKCAVNAALCGQLQCNFPPRGACGVVE